jgi:hypothetical protein
MVSFDVANTKNRLTAGTKNIFLVVKVAMGALEVRAIASGDQIADIFTKPVTNLVAIG